MNVYYKNSHTLNPLLTDRQKAQQTKVDEQLAQTLQRLQYKLEPLYDERATLKTELKTRKQFISAAQIKVHNKRLQRLNTEIQSIEIQIESLKQKP